MRRMPRNVWILGFAALFTDMSSEMIHCVLPLFLVTQLSTNVLMVGFIEGLAESIASLMKVFSGALSDFLGKRKTLVVAGYGLSSLVKPIFAIAQSSGMVLLARTMDRVGKGIRGAPRDALLADSVTPEIRGAAFGLRQSLDTVGAVLGPGIAFLLLLATSNDFRFVFWIAVIPALISVVLIAVGVEEPSAKGSERSGVKEPGANSSKQKRVNPLRFDALKQMGARYWMLVATALIFNLGNSSDAFLLLRAQKAGVAPHQIPLTMVVMSVVYAASAYPVGLLSDRIGRASLLIVGFLVYAAVYAGFACVDNSIHVWVLFAVYGLYLGLTQGLISAMVADRVPESLRATAFGFMNLSVGIAMLPASLLAGYLWDNVSIQAPFLVAAGLALTATAVFTIGSVVLRKEK